MYLVRAFFFFFWSSASKKFVYVGKTQFAAIFGIAKFNHGYKVCRHLKTLGKGIIIFY